MYISFLFKCKINISYKFAENYNQIVFIFSNFGDILFLLILSLLLTYQHSNFSSILLNFTKQRIVSKKVQNRIHDKAQRKVHLLKLKCPRIFSVNLKFMQKEEKCDVALFVFRLIHSRTENKVLNQFLVCVFVRAAVVVLLSLLVEKKNFDVCDFFILFISLGLSFVSASLLFWFEIFFYRVVCLCIDR